MSYRDKEALYTRVGVEEKAVVRALAHDPNTEYESISDAASELIRRGIEA